MLGGQFAKNSGLTLSHTALPNLSKLHNFNSSIGLHQAHHRNPDWRHDVTTPWRRRLGDTCVTGLVVCAHTRYFDSTWILSVYLTFFSTFSLNRTKALRVLEWLGPKLNFFKNANDIAWFRNWSPNVELDFPAKRTWMEVGSYETAVSLHIRVSIYKIWLMYDFMYMCPVHNSIQRCRPTGMTLFEGFLTWRKQTSVVLVHMGATYTENSRTETAGVKYLYCSLRCGHSGTVPKEGYLWPVL